MEKFLISVIVPVFNTKWELLQECLASIFRQEDIGYEVIVVDDCSRDRATFDHCLAYTKEKQNVHLYRNSENRGVSYSRNFGIEQAKGEYILFVDADDWIDDALFHELKASIEQEKPDTVFFDHMVALKSGNEPYRRQVEAKDCSKFSLNMIRRMVLSRDFNTVWNILFSREIILRENIRFPEGIGLGEDYIFNCRYLEKYQRGSYIKKELYYYRFNINSATNVFDFGRVKNTREGYFASKELLDTYFQEDNDTSKAMYAIYYSGLLSHLMKCVLAGNKKDGVDEILELDWVEDLKQHKPSGIAMNLVRMIARHRNYCAIVILAQVKKARMKVRYST